MTRIAPPSALSAVSAASGSWRAKRVEERDASESAAGSRRSRGRCPPRRAGPDRRRDRALPGSDVPRAPPARRSVPRGRRSAGRRSSSPRPPATAASSMVRWRRPDAATRSSAASRMRSEHLIAGGLGRRQCPLEQRAGLMRAPRRRPLAVLRAARTSSPCRRRPRRARSRRRASADSSARSSGRSPEAPRPRRRDAAPTARSSSCWASDHSSPSFERRAGGIRPTVPSLASRAAGTRSARHRPSLMPGTAGGGGSARDSRTSVTESVGSRRSLIIASKYCGELRPALREVSIANAEQTADAPPLGPERLELGVLDTARRSACGSGRSSRRASRGPTRRPRARASDRARRSAACP